MFLFQDCWGPRTQPRDQTCWLTCNHSLSLSQESMGVKQPWAVVGICMVLEQSLVEVCLEGLNGVSMCPVVWEWCMDACEKSVMMCGYCEEIMKMNVRFK